MTALWVAAAALGLAGLLLTALGWRRLRRRCWLTGAGAGTLGLTLILGVAAALLLISGLHTYQRLTHETLAAAVGMERLGPHHYRVVLEQGERMHMFLVHGDEWQLDARILKWHGPATLLGLDPLYRLERLSGRYSQVRLEREGQRSVYPLSGEERLDLWRMARDHGRWVPWIDAVYGNATYMPLTDGAHYLVYVSRTGLVTRPANAVARHAVAAWR